jgi:putative acetyltransferase
MFPSTDIRRSLAPDRDAIRRIHREAFPTEAEANLVDLLLDRAKAVISLVASEEDALVGHVLFSPVTVEARAELIGVGLAPVAVLPEWQRRGIGSALIRAGLTACSDAGYRFVVVLGEPAYYQRFGFRRAADFGLENEYGADEDFMVQELRPRGLPASGGLVQYAAEFAETSV